MKWVDVDKLLRESLEQEIRETKVEEDEEGPALGKIGSLLEHIPQNKLEKLKNRLEKSSRHKDYWWRGKHV